MKKLFLLASAALLSVSLFAQNQVKSADDAVKFKELSFDFGKVKRGTPVTHDFKFTNISNSPVIIETALASCGCTTPHKPEGAIAPGKSDVISAQYNAANPGVFNKTVTVKLAGIEGTVVLKITGEVLEADAYAKYQDSKTNTPGR
ncbi:MAG TPA: DUF1573 domain-containing protein [Puia sp.]|jgi:hypothetical protein|nr:DUF1573 domain-containing protein [Puia sp.]